MKSLLPAWEKLPPIRHFYARLLDPDGDTYDIWQNHLEAELEGLNEHHEVFRSNREWQEFLDSQRAIATDWDLRHTFSDADLRFLTALKVAWEPETMRHARWRASHTQLFGDDMLFNFSASFQELSAEQQEQLRKEIYEKITGRRYRLTGEK